MQTEIKNYLEQVRSHLHLDPATEKRVILEIYSHFQEKLAELRLQGLSDQEAGIRAIRSFGCAKAIARLVYEAHSRGTWVEALLTAQPHVLVALLFASHLWSVPLPAAFVLAAVAGITIVGRRHGKPGWLHPWIGYSLLPLFLGMYVSRNPVGHAVAQILGNDGMPVPGWALLAVPAFYALALWIVIRTTVRVIRRDWTLAALMFVPLPVFWLWFSFIDQSGGLLTGMVADLHQWDTSMACVLLAFAASAACFVRFRQRHIKAGAIISIGIVSGSILANRLWGDMRFLTLLLLAGGLLLFFLIPAALENICNRNAYRDDQWVSELIERPSTLP